MLRRASHFGFGVVFLLLGAVPDLHAQWEAFVPPEVAFFDYDLVSPGAQVFHNLIPDPVTFIRKSCLPVCRVLYHSAAETPVLTNITYSIEDYDGISSKWGNRPQIYIKYSTRYLQQYWNNNHGDVAATLYETQGILYHELTHGYQYAGNQMPSHVVEGVADAVRVAVKYVPYTNRKAGGSYTDSYQRTGFFLDWLNQERLPGYDFLRRFNQSGNSQLNKAWSWDVVRALTGVDVDTLWAEYQSFLQSPLAASFTFVSHDPGRTVDFEDKSISTTPVMARRWDFGDGTTSTQANPRHVYAQDGTYAVALTVTTATGAGGKTHLVSVPPVIPYGQSQSKDCTQNWIVQVSIGGVVYPSSISTYADHTNVVIPLYRGQTYPIALCAGFFGRVWSGGTFRLWIDYNQDRTLDDAKELAFDSGFTNVPLVTGQIVIPNGAKDGLTRLRVSLKGGGPELVNATGLGGQVTAQYNDSPTGEGKEKAFDNSDYSKYLTFHDKAWIQFSFAQGQQYALSSYSITSANDYPARDPRDWRLLGSTDGANWVTIDTRSGQLFSGRFQTKNYGCNSQMPYRYYRFDVTKNNGGRETQFAEVRLFASVYVPPLSCGSFASGEVEDYTVSLTGLAFPTLMNATEGF